MKQVKIFLLSLASSFAAVAADIDVTSGQLEGLLSDDKYKSETSLKLKGTIDARDLAALEHLSPEVKSLDLKEVKIEALTMPNRKYFGRTLFNEGEIPPYAFFKTELQSIILPESVSTICEGAFAGSPLKEIIVPEGVTTIGDYAFYGCSDLKSVSLPASLKSIGKGAFGNCRELLSVDLSATGIKEIPERAFAGSMQLSEVKLPSDIEKVGREAFSHTKIEVLNLSNVKEFDAYALSSMPWLTELTLNPDALINDGLLMDDTSLLSITKMPENIPAYFAANCGSLDAKHLEQASTIGNYAFANTLVPESTELYLTGSVAKIERGALSGLSGLTKIDVTQLGGNVPEVDEYSFEGISQPDIVLWVDDDYFDLWNSDPVWKLFKVQSSSQTAIGEITSEISDGIRISYNNGLIVVESESIINDVRIYTPDGRMAFVASPGRERVEIEASSLPSGIVIVAVSDENGNARTSSILLK